MMLTFMLAEMELPFHEHGGDKSAAARIMMKMKQMRWLMAECPGAQVAVESYRMPQTLTIIHQLWVTVPENIAIHYRLMWGTEPPSYSDVVED